MCLHVVILEKWLLYLLSLYAPIKVMLYLYFMKRLLPLTILIPCHSHGSVILPRLLSQVTLMPLLSFQRVYNLGIEQAFMKSVGKASSSGFYHMMYRIFCQLKFIKYLYNVKVDGRLKKRGAGKLEENMDESGEDGSKKV